MTLSSANEELLMAAVALDAVALKASLRAGADIHQVDQLSSGLLHTMLTSFEQAEETATQTHTARHGLAGFQNTDLKEELLQEIQALKEKATAAFHVLFKAAPEDALDLLRIQQGYPPLVLTAALGLGQVLSELVKRGADPDVRTSMNATALHHAARCSHIGCMRRLAGFKVPVDIQNQQGQTPAHMAAANENLLAMRELKRMGANFSLKNTSGRTPADELGLHDMKLKQQWEAWENRHEADLRAKHLDKALADQAADAPGAAKPRRPRF